MELQHHGVEGQKWGVKNGPPYPLSRTRKNARAYRSAINKTNQQIAERKVSIIKNNKQLARAKEIGDKQTVKELAAIGKKELNSVKLLEIQKQNIIKDAKSGGFIVARTKYDKQYDGRSKNEKAASTVGFTAATIAGGGIGGIAYNLGDYLIAKNLGYLVDLPMYTVKVPKK